MKRKELKNLVNKIAEAEWVIKTSKDKDAIYAAEQEIMRLSGKVKSLEDMTIIDELVQELLNEKS